MKIGTEVKKVTGDYSFEGVIVSKFDKQDGQERFVVEDDRGALHIYSEKNLAPIGNWADHQYLKVLKELLDHGVYREGRNGSTYGLFGKQLRFDLQKGFPLLTTKKTHFKSILVELLWFIKGKSTLEYLHHHGVSIWDEWADENGELGPVYGKQWRDWNGYEGQSYRIDQLENVIEGLKRDPYGRRHIVSAWNPEQVDKMALPPCHMMFQFHVSEGKLNCQLYQRSADWFLGVPFNIASYALLTMLVAREVGLQPGEFIHTFGDLHLYANHVEQAREQIGRQPFETLSTVYVEGDKNIWDLEPSDFYLLGYKSWPAIKAEVSA